MSNYEIRRLAQELARQGRIVDDLATKPQLAYSSIEAGSVLSYDEEGNLRLVVCEQGDGTQSITVVDGPPPASPSRPSVAVDGPIITTVWDGELAGVEELPKDFQHIEVHVTPVPGDGTVLGVSTIEGRDGGQATVAVSQSGSYEVALVAVSQAGKRSVPSEAVTVEVTLVDIDGALKLVKESADGKNRLTWDPAQPPAQYEGAPGDTWFQTSDDGIVGQWRWTGAVWESQALTHEVIASIDLGKATVGELDGGRIEANTIRAEQIAAGAIDGKTITGATVRTSAGFPRVQLDDAGLHSWDETGRKTFHADQNTGAVSIVGEFMSGQAGQPRVKIDPDDWASIFDTNENGETVNMNGAGIAIDGAAGRGLSIYHGVYTSHIGAPPAGGAGAIDGPGRQSLRMASIGHTWLRQFEASSRAKSELYLWPQFARLSVQNAGGHVLSEVEVSGGHAAIRKRSAAGEALSGLQLWDDTAKLSVKNAAGYVTGEVAVGDGWVRLTGRKVSTVSSEAYMGKHTYSGTADNWGIRYYKGDDQFGEIGSPGGMSATNSFGVVAVGERALELHGQGAHLQLRKDNTSAIVLSKTITERRYSSAANVYITGAGTLGRTSSARKYKADEQVIKTDEFADALLSIPFKSWLDRTELEQWEAFKKHVEEKPGCPVGPDLAECPQDEPRRHIGAVAEDFVDAGLSQFVTFDELGEPDGLQYDRIGVALIPLVARQRDRISRLEDQVAGQAERLEVLEASLTA